MLGLLAAAGCQTEEMLRDRERTRLISEKWKEANSLAGGFSREDPQSLERCVDLHREITELAPSNANGWQAYGQALSGFGWHFHSEYREVMEQVDSARPEEKAALEAEAQRYREEFEKHFHDSNLAYETHFRDCSVNIIHPYSYERVMRHYEVLGDFERALFYLQKFIDSFPEMNAINRKKLEQLRRLYAKQLKK